MEQNKDSEHVYLEAGANAVMGIFARVDAVQPKVSPYLHTAELTKENDIEYFLKKLEEVENLYKKTVVLAYDPEGKIIANVPTRNLEDGTDLSEGLSTVRNTLKGLMNQYKKIKANIGLAGVNYAHKEGHAQ